MNSHPCQSEACSHKATQPTPSPHKNMYPASHLRPTRISQPAPVATPAVRQMYTHKDWDFAHCTSTLSPSHVIDAFEHKTGIKPPEITFLDNFLRIRHNKSGIVLNFSTSHALLECVDSHVKSLPPHLQSKPIEVKASSLWKPHNTTTNAINQSPQQSPFRSPFAPYTPPTDVNIHAAKPIRPMDPQLSTTTTPSTTSVDHTSHDHSAGNHSTVGPAESDDLAAALSTKLSFGFDWSYTSPYRGHLSLRPKPTEADINAAAVPLSNALSSDASTSLMTEQCSLVEDQSPPHSHSHGPSTIKCDAQCEHICTCLPTRSRASSNSSNNGETASNSHKVTHAVAFQPPMSPLPGVHWVDAVQGAGIDYNLLRRPDPILFYSSVSLYEDELHDNGASTLSVKARVMDLCWFALLRMFVRVDGVVVRVRDTRFFHQFGTNVIYRETKIQEVMFEDMARLGLPVSVNEYRDVDRVAAMLPVKYMNVEQLQLPE